MGANKLPPIDDLGRRPCTKCGRYFLATGEFFYTKRGRLQGRCLSCHRDQAEVTRRQWRAKNRDRVRQTDKAWKKANRDRVRQTDKAWKKANREKLRNLARSHAAERAQRRKQALAAETPQEREIRLAKRRLYRKNNPGAERAYKAAWKKRNAESHRKSSREWALRNPEKTRLAARRWEENNRDKVRLSSRVSEANRRARKKAAGGSITSKDIKVLFDLQAGACFYCGEGLPENFHLDHFVPVSKGGSGGPENIVLACPSCNISKNDLSPDDPKLWDRMLRRLERRKP